MIQRVEEIQELEGKMLIPLISISSVILFLLNPNSTRDSLGAIDEVLKCGELFNTEFSQRVIFCIKTLGKMIGGGDYKNITKEMFEEYQKRYSEKKSGMLKDFGSVTICPLPNLPSGGETKDYETGMRLVGEEIVSQSPSKLN